MLRAFTPRQSGTVMLLIAGLLALFPVQADLWSELATGDLKSLKRGSYDVNARHPQNGSTPLITATVLQNHDVVRWLIKKGADVNMRGADGGTALHAAALFGRTDVVRTLLNNGATVAVFDDNGSLPIDAADLDWATTDIVAGMLQLQLDKKTTMAGKAESARLLMK